MILPAPGAAIASLSLPRSGLRPRYCSAITGLIAAEGEPMRGVHEALRYFRHTGYKLPSPPPRPGRLSPPC